MALTPEQIAAQIEDIGIDIPQSLNDSIFAAAQLVVEELKANPDFPVDTGNLRNSLRARIIDGQFLGITMLNYGYFQNFGVAGTANTKRQFGVDPIVASFLPPREGNTYSFNKQKTMIGGDLPFGVRKSIHKNGLNGKMFLDMESLVDRVVELVNQNFEL